MNRIHDTTDPFGKYVWRNVVGQLMKNAGSSFHIQSWFLKDTIYCSGYAPMHDDKRQPPI